MVANPKLMIGFYFLVILLVTACGVKNPNLVPVPREVIQPSPIVSMSTTHSAYFPLINGEISFQQNAALTNQTTALVEIEKVGTNVRAFTKNDFRVTENGQPVANFELAVDQSHSEQVVDIALVVDVTISMNPFIELAKRRLTDFIRAAKANGYHTRVCVSTFGDHTVKKCERFFDNDPQGSNQQTDELIAEISRISIFRDPLDRDADENPMRALIDVGEAPWRSDAQKFVILVTDETFLYSPGNEGSIESTRGILPPTMQEVHTSLEASQVVVMAVTPRSAGYNSNFQNLSSIVEKSNGEHFLFTDVIARPALLDEILGRIISRVNTTYRITYDAEELDATHSTRPLAERSIVVELIDSSIGTILNTRTSAEYPDGRPQYQTEWAISGNDVSTDATVIINGQSVDSTSYQILGGQLRFNSAPSPGSEIRVEYYYSDMYLNLRLEPISLSPDVRESQLRVFLNGVPARAEDLQISRDLAGNVSITLLRSVTSGDHYRIRQFNGINLRVE